MAQGSVSYTHLDVYKRQGVDTARDNIEAALSLGLGKIGIADHAPGFLFWGIRDMELYLSELEHLREEYQERIQVKAGIEINLCGLAGQTDMPEGYEDSMDIEMCIRDRGESIYVLANGVDEKEALDALEEFSNKESFDD